MRPQFGEVARTRFLCEGGAREKFFFILQISCLFHLYSTDYSYIEILHFYTNFMITLTLNWFSKGKKGKSNLLITLTFSILSIPPSEYFCYPSSPWKHNDFWPKRNEELRRATVVADGDLQGFHHVSERKSSLSLWFERKVLGKEGSFCQKSR